MTCVCGFIGFWFSVRITLARKRVGFINNWQIYAFAMAWLNTLFPIYCRVVSEIFENHFHISKLVWLGTNAWHPIRIEIFIFISLMLFAKCVWNFRYASRWAICNVHASTVVSSSSCVCAPAMCLSGCVCPRKFQLNCCHHSRHKWNFFFQLLPSSYLFLL